MEAESRGFIESQEEHYPPITHKVDCLLFSRLTVQPNLWVRQPKLLHLSDRAAETELFPTWKHEIDENQTNLPIMERM